MLGYLQYALYLPRPPPFELCNHGPELQVPMSASLRHWQGMTNCPFGPSGVNKGLDLGHH